MKKKTKDRVSMSLGMLLSMYRVHLRDLVRKCYEDTTSPSRTGFNRDVLPKIREIIPVIEVPIKDPNLTRAGVRVYRDWIKATQNNDRKRLHELTFKTKKHTVKPLWKKGNYFRKPKWIIRKKERFIAVDLMGLAKIWKNVQLKSLKRLTSSNTLPLATQPLILRLPELNVLTILSKNVFFGEHLRNYVDRWRLDLAHIPDLEVIFGEDYIANLINDYTQRQIRENLKSVYDENHKLFLENLLKYSVFLKSHMGLFELPGPKRFIDSIKDQPYLSFHFSKLSKMRI